MKKIPNNITCLTFDDILEVGINENDVNWFKCGQCMIEFGTSPDVRFPKLCPNCGENFVWLEKV